MSRTSPESGTEALLVTRRQVLGFRLRRQGLTDARPDATRVLRAGIPDSGPDGAGWALANRGTTLADTDGLLAWTMRGAPHLYLRADVAAVATATAPLSEADARSRIYDAAKPLVAADIEILDALGHVADLMRGIVTEPMPKGDVSARLTRLLPDAYLRFCRPCGVTHIFEMPFRLAALQAGLELAPGTAPPVLQRIEGFPPPSYTTLGDAAEPTFDIAQGFLGLCGPVRVADAAKYADAPVRAMTAHWPDKVVEVAITDEDRGQRARPRQTLAQDRQELTATEGAPVTGTRLLGPFDPYLQLQDRALLVPDEGQRKDLWRILGRPGALLRDGEIVGTWRPRARAKSLTVAATPWTKLTARARRAFEEQAERLATHRGAALGAVAWD